MSSPQGSGIMNVAVALLLSTTVSFAQFRATPEPQSDPSEYNSSPSLWYHNGSTMYLVAEGAKREFYYQDPRPEMVQAGAHQGSLLFTGRSVGGRYFGTAYIYNPRCGRTSYQVSGPILDNYDRVVLHGQAPLFGPNCQVRGHLADALEFTLLKSGEAATVRRSDTLPPAFLGIWIEAGAKDNVCKASEWDTRGGHTQYEHYTRLIKLSDRALEAWEQLDEGHRMSRIEKLSKSN